MAETSCPRKTRLERCFSTVQDSLVVGAGINGAVVAAALAGKGAQVTLIDKGDFASCTSQESSNLAWGGIKYLETYEFGLVWKLCRCRNQLMDAYPTQLEEIRFFTTIARGFRKPVFLVYIGALLYWVMGRFRTRPPVMLTRAAIRRRAPEVRADDAAGGMEYSDCLLVENDARFTFGFVRRALEHGGNAINYLELTAADWRDGLWHCTLQDRVTGESGTLRARSLVNTAGPYADDINQLLGVQSAYRHVLSRGAHIIVPQITAVRRIMTFFASDGRLFFMIPLGDRTAIGTTDDKVAEVTDRATDADIEFLLENANRLLSLERPLVRSDILATRCGVRPLAVKVEAEVGKTDWTAMSRRHQLDVQADRRLVTVYGGKLTDCINVGEKVAGVAASFGIELHHPDARWFGEDAMPADFEERCSRAGLEEGRGMCLWRRYGAASLEILESIQADPAMGMPLLGNYVRAELMYIAGSEQVVHLEDFLRRRSLLALTTAPDDLLQQPDLREAARILFGDEAEAEINRYASGLSRHQ